MNKKQPGKSTEKIKIQRRNTHSFPSSRTEQKTSSGSEHMYVGGDKEFQGQNCNG